MSSGIISSGCLMERGTSWLKGVVLYGDAIVLKLILVEERMGEHGTKPQALVDHKNKSLSAGLVSVGCCTSDDWHVLFAYTMFSIVGGDITNSANVKKRNKVTSKCTSIGMGMGIKLAPREDRISLNRSNWWVQMMNMSNMMTCRLVGHKQMRKTKERSVSWACLQSFNGMSLFDICLATKRVSHLSSVGSELSLFGVSSWLQLLHHTNDGSDLFNGDVTNDMIGSTGFAFLVMLFLTMQKPLCQESRPHSNQGQ